MNSSYAPNESHSTIVQEETWLQGTLLSNFFFGIQTTLAVFAFLAVLQRRVQNRSRIQIALLVYITILLALTTVSQALSIDWIQMAFITQRDYPGGPSMFLINEFAIPVNVGSTIFAVCANWIMESLLVRYWPKYACIRRDDSHMCHRYGGVT